MSSILALGLFSLPASAQSEFERDTLTLVTESGKHQFAVEIAKTTSEHARGLMFRKSIGEREGMLFVHPEPRYVSMWMRNTYIPLDMLFIRADGTIHRIEANTEPLSERIIESGDRVAGVLEIAGGLAEKLKIKPGDQVYHSHFKP